MIESNLKTTHNTIFFLSLTGSFATTQDGVKTLVMIIILIIIVLWPLFIAIFLSRNIQKLPNKEYRDQYGSMYMDTKTNNAT